MAKYLGLKEDGTYHAAIRETEFLRHYEKNWSEILKDTYYQSEQLDIGHKFRPRLVYWGAIVKGSSNLTEYDFDIIAKVAVCIEIVHKASILLDDFIDQDTARHGKPAFHTIHGVDRTVIYSLNLLSRALRILNNTFAEYSSSSFFVWKSMNTLTTTLEDMTLGVLKELDLPEKLNQSISTIKEIMHLETSTLITNSLLMGIYLAQIDDENAIRMIENIGRNFGFIFQTLNDLEPFCTIKNSQHKGSINTDFSRNRKNICVALLYPMLTKKETSLIKNSAVSDIDKIIIQYFDKYNIYQNLMEEIDIAHKSMLQDINQLTDYIPGMDESWHAEFSIFVTSVVSICKNRLK